MNLQIQLQEETLPFYFVSHKNGRKTLEIQAFDGAITVAVQYDCNRRPLELNGAIQAGDLVEIALLDHKITLSVNGEIRDEEWPHGNRLFELGDSFTPNANIEIGEWSDTAAEEPSVLSTFENAEGWQPGGGVFVGDCMPYRREDEYHVLYLKDRHHHHSKWGLGAHQWAHISTKDFQTWSIHPMAVEITEAWEGSICTGSWIQHEGKEYLYYTVRRADRKPAPICRSVSTDGYHFAKDPSFGFTISERYRQTSARDPKVILGADGLFHMFLTTSLAREERGCLAHYVSKDMEAWEDFGEPIYIAPDKQQPECPDYFEYRGRYYLIFSLGGKAHYMVSSKPFEDFTMPKDPIIPCASVPKCAEWNGKFIFAGFQGTGGYGGTMTFKAATVDQNGEFVFEAL